MTETWLAIAGYEGKYEISDMGRVRSLPRLDSIGRRLRGGILTQIADSHGYLRIALHKDGEARYGRVVHQLVLETFVGPRPEGWQCRHLNGDPSDNRLENLAWGTKSENMLDAVRRGTNHNASKLVCPTCGGAYSAWQNGDRYCHPCKNAKRRKENQC